MSAITIALDVFGSNERLQLLLYDTHEEPAAHIRLSGDLSRVDEIVVREETDIVANRDSATDWEVERDNEGSGLTPYVPVLSDSDVWVVEWRRSYWNTHGRYDVVRVSVEHGGVWRFGHKFEHYNIVCKWLMKIELPVR